MRRGRSLRLWGSRYGVLVGEGGNSISMKCLVLDFQEIPSIAMDIAAHTAGLKGHFGESEPLMLLSNPSRAILTFTS